MESTSSFVYIVQKLSSDVFCLTPACFQIYITFRSRIITARKRNLGQGYVFTSVSDSVHGGCLPHCMLGYTAPPPPRQTPHAKNNPHLWTETPLLAHPQPPWADTPQDITGCGQQSGGTHLTGIHNAYLFFFPLFLCEKSTTEVQEVGNPGVHSVVSANVSP